MIGVLCPALRPAVHPTLDYSFVTSSNVLLIDIFETDTWLTISASETRGI